MTTDLHVRLLAAVTARRALAEALNGESWTAVRYIVAVADGYGDEAEASYEQGFLDALRYAVDLLASIYPEETQ